jgi:hypothetical protein
VGVVDPESKPAHFALEPHASWLSASLDVSDASYKLKTFAVVFQLHMTVSFSLWAWTSFDDWRRLLTIPLQFALFLVVSTKLARFALGITLAIVAYEWSCHPLAMLPAFIANHNMVELLCIVVLLLVKLDDEKDSALGLRTLQWTTVLVFVASAVQKLLHGTYMQGQFFAWSISTGGRWENVLGLLVPNEELATLREFGRTALVFDRDRLVSVPPGPYVLRSWPCLLASITVPIAELLLPLGLFWKQSRLPAVAAIIALLFIIELVAVELIFGALMLNLITLFLDRGFSRWKPAVFILIYVLIGVRRVL